VARRGAEHVNAGAKVVIAGTIAPAKTALVIQVERLDGRRFKHIGDQPVRAAAGRYRAAVKIGLARTYRLRVAFRGDRLNPSVRTAPLLIRGVRLVHTGGTVAS